MAKKPKFTEIIEEAIEREAVAKPVIAGGLLTNRAEGRKPLPPVEDARFRSLLHEILDYSPEVYEEYICLLERGAFYNAAAEAVGISEKTLADWAAKGRRDLKNGVDSVYSRLTHDVRRAVAKARVKAEMTIAETDPKKWLSLGPGRIFGNQWVEEKSVDQEPDVLDIELKEQLVLENKEETGMVVANIDPKSELEMIEALEAAGQGSWPESHKEALRKQIREKE